MEFTFNVNDFFREPAVYIDNSLLPSDYRATRMAARETAIKVAQVINAIGEASALAQNLSKPITTAEKLRKSENQRIYILTFSTGNNGKGAVLGMLKVGKKMLYLFDREGTHYKVSSLCVLDFYIYEACQRQGLGKELFDFMLATEHAQPEELALDRPSDKLLNFLSKHYSLEKPIKQMNNYVVFDGFFDHVERRSILGQEYKHLLTGSAEVLQNTPSTFGRYAAAQPPCSMAEIIHNQSSTINKKSSNGETRSPTEKPTPKLERPQSLSLQQIEDGQREEPAGEEKEEGFQTKEDNDYVDKIEKELEAIQVDDDCKDKNELSKSPVSDILLTSRKTPSHLTEQGFFDLKFYHNKLW